MAAAQLKRRLREGQSAPFDKLRMSGEEVSRRALLGAAVGLPLLPDSLSSSFRRMPESTCLSARGERWIPDQVRDDELWQAALAAFRAAEAAVGEIEAATAGYSLEDEEALLPAHEAACDAMDAALGRLMLVPAPHLMALGVKFEAAFAHEMKTAPDDDLRFRALLQDIIGLHHAQRRGGATVGQPARGKALPGAWDGTVNE